LNEQEPVASSRQSSLEENMLEIKQSVRVTDGIIAVFWDVFSQDVSLEAEISEVLAITRVSESASCERFQSKEDLVSAFLKDRHAAWMRWFEDEIEPRCKATGGGLEIIADVLQEGFEDPNNFGVAFINVVSECSDVEKEPFAIVGEQK
jgi:AcrR family transcriptional regulator